MNIPPPLVPSALLALLLLPAFLVPRLSDGEDRSGPERWEPSIAAFEKRDREDPPAENALLFVGSSSIRMWDLEKSWPEAETINNGFGGSTLADSIHYFARVIGRYESPRALLLYAGDNDVARGLEPAEVREDFDDLVDLVHAEFPELPIFFIAIKPSRARWELWPEMSEANRLIEERCGKADQLHFVDIARPMLEGAEGAPDEKWFVSDGLHLSVFGYEEWTREVNEALRQAGATP